MHLQRSLVTPSNTPSRAPQTRLSTRPRAKSPLNRAHNAPLNVCTTPRALPTRAQPPVNAPSSRYQNTFIGCVASQIIVSFFSNERFFFFSRLLKGFTVLNQLCNLPVKFPSSRCRTPRQSGGRAQICGGPVMSLQNLQLLKLLPPQQNMLRPKLKAPLNWTLTPECFCVSCTPLAEPP